MAKVGKAKERVVEYRPAPTIYEFMMADDFVRGIRGPVGSGKSTGCSIEIMRRAMAQAAAPDGVRYTRWAVVRNTYRELHDTTLKTWLDWNREDLYGSFHLQYMFHHVRIPGSGKVPGLDCEVLFRALDRPEDVKKILSLELTGAWINEAREVPKGIVDALTDRIGRYPSVRLGGCTWRGLIMDTNAPDDDHWWYRLAEEDRPAGWRFFSQPPGLIEAEGSWVTNERAENLENLEPGYYDSRWPGKSRDHILVYYCNQYGFVQEGKPVYPEYVDHVHAAEKPLEPVRGLPLYIGVDFGLTPAAVIGQKMVDGRWWIIDELVTEDIGIKRFSEVLGARLRHDYAGFPVEIYGDPAGGVRAQTDEKTCFEVMEVEKLPIEPAPTNDWVLRRESVATALRRMVGGKQGFLISPKCRVTRKGMAGGYAYRRMRISGVDPRYHDQPDKNRFSHSCDAMQYMMLGAGEGRTVLESPKSYRPVRYPKHHISHRMV